MMYVYIGQDVLDSAPYGRGRDQCFFLLLEVEFLLLGIGGATTFDGISGKFTSISIFNEKF